MTEQREYAALQEFRCGTLGQTLIDSLDRLVTDGDLVPGSARRILDIFDRILARSLMQLTAPRLTLKKGRLVDYNHINDVWTFTLSEGVEVKWTDGREPPFETARPTVILAHSSALLQAVPNAAFAAPTVLPPGTTPTPVAVAGITPGVGLRPAPPSARTGPNLHLGLRPPGSLPATVVPAAVPAASVGRRRGAGASPASGKRPATRSASVADSTESGPASNKRRRK